MCFVCAFHVEILSLYMPRNLVEMENGTVVLLISIMLSSIIIIFDRDGKA